MVKSLEGAKSASLDSLKAFRYFLARRPFGGSGHSQWNPAYPIEAPVEFIHGHKRSIIHQRELHNDAPSFALPLRAALREAPKVIQVGEMRRMQKPSGSVGYPEGGTVRTREYFERGEHDGKTAGEPPPEAPEPPTTQSSDREPEMVIG